MTISISTTEEVRQAIKKIREKDPNFNLSGFLGNSILKYQPVDSYSLDYIMKEISSAKEKLNQAESDLDYWKQKKREYEMNKELEYREKKVSEEKRLEKEKEIKRLANDVFKDEVGRDMTEEEIEDYYYKKNLSPGDEGKVTSPWDYINKYIKKEEIKEDELIQQEQ